LDFARFGLAGVGVTGVGSGAIELPTWTDAQSLATL
jgi:hypothetical protein